MGNFFSMGYKILMAYSILEKNELELTGEN
jgi:hypothetical protein